jgi:hypothetical protein
VRGGRRPGNYSDVSAGAPPESSLVSVPFRRESRDGRLRFELVGGEREPHRAIGVLREARSGRVVKEGTVEYDEYAEFLGWMGSAVVLRQRVDEGPGCVVSWIDPQVTWPISLVSEAAGSRPLIECYDGIVVLKPADTTFAVVAANGRSVTFVDEVTMAADVVDTGHEADPERGRRLADWMEAGGMLALAYGAPNSGAVARVDLRGRKLASVWVPRECAPPPSP